MPKNTAETILDTLIGLISSGAGAAAIVGKQMVWGKIKTWLEDKKTRQL